MRNINPFRGLNGKEEEAASVVDNRDITNGNPNNKVLITCDHASNDAKFLKPLDYEEDLMRSQEYFDIGAADFTHALSETLACLAVLSNFTKLYVDPAKPLVDSQLIRTYY